MTAPTVLIVDDDDLHRELVADYLALAGMVVRHACDGREALTLMKHQAPDLVLLDVQMPELDGLGVVGEMQRTPSLAAIPVLFLSGVGAAHVRIRALELGADDFVSKHSPPAEIVARVRAAIRRRPRAPLQALAGTIGPRGLGIDDAMQTLLATRRAGRLVLSELAASLDCVGGTLVGARYRQHQGRAALERIVLTARGGFAIDLDVPVEDGPGLSLIAALVEVDECRAALGAVESIVVELADGAPPGLVRRKALFPLTLAELLVSLDGDLRAATALVAAALAAAHLIPLRPEVT